MIRLRYSNMIVSHMNGQLLFCNLLVTEKEKFNQHSKSFGYCIHSDKFEHDGDEPITIHIPIDFGCHYLPSRCFFEYFIDCKFNSIKQCLVGDNDAINNFNANIVDASLLFTTCELNKLLTKQNKFLTGMTTINYFNLVNQKHAFINIFNNFLIDYVYLSFTDIDTGKQIEPVESIEIYVDNVCKQHKEGQFYSSYTWSAIYLFLPPEPIYLIPFTFNPETINRLKINFKKDYQNINIKISLSEIWKSTLEDMQKS